MHSYLILAYAGSEKAAEDVGFYYAANALGRFIGTLLSGLLYQWGGLMSALAGSALMLTLCWLITLALPVSDWRRPASERNVKTATDRTHRRKTALMDENAAVASLAALAQGMRLRVFRALVGAGPQGLTPGALSATLDVPASTLSFHLKELMHAGLVSQQRDGRHLIYRPALEQMNALLSYLSAHCCQAAGSASCDSAPPAARLLTTSTTPSRSPP